METSAPSRLTIIVAIAAIVAAIGMLVAGVVLAPSGESEDVEASLVAATAPAAPHGDGDDDHAHDEAAAPATTAPPAHDDAAPHAHDTVEVASASATPTTAGLVVPAAAEAHDHHDVVTTTPSTTPIAAPPGDAPGTTTTVHDHGSTTVPATPTPTAAPAVPTGPIVSLDDARLTTAQQAAGRDLLDATRAAMARFPDEAAVVAAGYQSIGDAGTGFEHFVSWGYLADGAELDPDRIESIVLRVDGGVKTVASAMYILTIGSTMADVPELAGELTTWHDHQNLCWDGTRVVAVTRADGSCPRGVFQPTPPMLHVWLTEQPCGPFSGIEGTHGAACAAHH